MGERLAQSTRSRHTANRPHPTGRHQSCAWASGHTPAPWPSPEPPGFGGLLTNAGFSLFPSSFALILTPHWGLSLRVFPQPSAGAEAGGGHYSAHNREAPRADSLGTQTWRWASSGISGPDFGPGVQLAGPQPTEPGQALSLSGLGAFLGAPGSFLSTR